MKVVDIPGFVEEVLARYGRASSSKRDVEVPKARVVTPVASEAGDLGGAKDDQTW